MAPLRSPPWEGSVKCRMLMSHTSTQMTEMTFASESPNSSSLRFSGVLSVVAVAIESWICPIAVLCPVRTTTASADPLTTVEPCGGRRSERREDAQFERDWATPQLGLVHLTVLTAKRMLIMSCLTALSSLTTSVIFLTDIDSPVRTAWSTLNEDELKLITRQSAGILSPTETATMSPGTSADACTLVSRDDRSTRVSSGEYSLRAWRVPGQTQAGTRLVSSTVHSPRPSAATPGPM